MIGAGQYAARAIPIVDDKLGEVGCRFGESDQKGTPFAQVLCQVIRGPFAGQTITWSGYFSGGATEHTIKALRNFGFTGDDLASFQDQRPENEVSIVVQMKESNRGGRSWPTVAWVNSPNRGMKIEKPIEGSALKRFAAEFKSNLKTAPAIAGTKAVLQSPTDEEVPAGGDTGGSTWERGETGGGQRDDNPPPPSDDDIPF